MWLSSAGACRFFATFHRGGEMKHPVLRARKTTLREGAGPLGSGPALAPLEAAPGLARQRRPVSG